MTVPGIERMDIHEMRAAFRERVDRQSQILRLAEVERRQAFNPDEEREYRELEVDINQLRALIENEQDRRERNDRGASGLYDHLMPAQADTRNAPRIESRTSEGERWIDTHGREVRALRRDERMADLPGGPRMSEADFGGFIRGKVSGRWDGVNAEVRQMGIEPNTAGGFLVPAPLSAQVFDLARNQARVMQAGARTIPMDATTLAIAKVTGDPAGGWRAEHAAVTQDELTIGRVLLEAKTLAVLVKLSRELFEDAGNGDSVITNSIARSLAVELDRALLYGDGLTDQPLGLRNVTGLQLVDAASAALPDYDAVIDAIGNVWDANYNPNAMILAPRTRRDLAKLKDAEGRYTSAPAVVADLTMLSTNQVDATTNSDILLGQFDQLLVGMRTELQIQFLDQTFAENLQVAFLAWLRADVAVVDINAFSGVENIAAPL